MAIRFCKGEFKKAHEIFLNQKVEYISIFDRERFICCCYNDEKCDKIMKHILNMTTSIEACKKISEINKIEIISFNENEAIIKLLAKVYGGTKNWWTLHMKTIYTEEDGKIKIKECKVGM